MKFYRIQPAVPGEVGDNLVADTSVHPPIVHRLHFLLDEVPDDALFSAFPVYMVSEEAKQELLKVGFTGIRFDDVEIEMSPTFIDAYGEADPGQYFWLKVEGQAFHDDFGLIDKRPRLVVSQRALDLLEELGIPGADIKAAENDV